MERPVTAPEGFGQHREHHGTPHDSHQLERQAAQVARDRVRPQLAHRQPAAEQERVEPVGAEGQHAADEDPASELENLARSVRIPA